MEKMKFKNIRAQIVFWILLIGMQFGFNSNMFPIPDLFIPVSLTIIYTALVLYGNVFFIFPKFHKTQSNGRHLWISLVFVFGLTLVYAFADLELMKYLDFTPKHDFKYPFFPVFMRALFWTVLVYLGSTIYMLQDRLRKQTEESKVIVEEKLNTELKYLKAQINPHFLFNALNNIYSLSYLKSDKGPDAVLKLSGMLRYVLEDCQADHVRLSSEIEYIENFIDFQQMKSQSAQHIEFNHFETNRTVPVAPMLFISFIENAFKYSKIESTEGAYVKMKLATKENWICFELVNSIPEKGKAQSGSGKGIENTKQRLGILYPGTHEIDISETETEFRVNLNVQLS